MSHKIALHLLIESQQNKSQNFKLNLFISDRKMLLLSIFSYDKYTLKSPDKYSVAIYFPLSLGSDKLKLLMNFV